MAKKQSKKGRLPTNSQAKAKKSNKQNKVTTNTTSDVYFNELVERANGKKIVLHVGCGNKDGGYGLHNIFRDTNTWYEVRLDIDPSLEPDIVSDMKDMKGVPSQSVDALWSSHNIEHVYPHEVVPVLAEFRRVLKPGGSALIATPNLQEVAKYVAEGKLETPLYNSPMGPICALDIIYGFRPNLKDGHHFMAHKTGFTNRTIANKLAQAGFGAIESKQDGLNLLVLANNVPVGADGKPVIKFSDPDINAMMAQRDEIDQEPVLWKGFPPKG